MGHTESLMISLVNPSGLPNRSWVWTFYVITFGTQKPIADTVHPVYLATPAEALRSELSPSPCSPFSSLRPSQPFTPLATALACSAFHTPWGQHLLCSTSIICKHACFPYLTVSYSFCSQHTQPGARHSGKISQVNELGGYWQDRLRTRVLTLYSFYYPFSH